MVSRVRFFSTVIGPNSTRGRLAPHVNAGCLGFFFLVFVLAFGSCSLHARAPGGPHRVSSISGTSYPPHRAGSVSRVFGNRNAGTASPRLVSFVTTARQVGRWRARDLHRARFDRFGSACDETPEPAIVRHGRQRCFPGPFRARRENVPVGRDGFRSRRGARQRVEGETAGGFDARPRLVKPAPRQLERKRGAHRRTAERHEARRNPTESPAHHVYRANLSVGYDHPKPWVRW
mmetsp:Transcript_9335/g.34828  ORF Transcript_9335/g.34828 Transcript_9335/m.34828 type:complete len:233 (-) Transcript_9335:617-1315(-)